MKLSKNNGYVYGVLAALLLGMMSVPAHASTIKHQFESSVHDKGFNSHMTDMSTWSMQLDDWDDAKWSGKFDKPALQNAIKHGGLFWVFVTSESDGIEAWGFFSPLIIKLTGGHFGDSDCLDPTPTPNAVPLPSAAWLFVSGLIGFGTLRSKQRRVQV